MTTLAQLLSDATRCFNTGNLAQAELLSQHVLREHGPQAHAFVLLGAIAYSVGLPAFAVSHYEKALQLEPGNATAREQLAMALKRRDERREPPRFDPAGPRYLLIKAWGAGFWADLDHVLGQLLLAEMTGRIPIVHWGGNSLFRDPGCTNAFESFFEPVSPARLRELLRAGQSYFPPKWSPANLAADEVNKWAGEYSRMPGLYVLARDEDVAVGDFYSAVRDLMPWIPAGHPLHGMDQQSLYRLLFTRYIRRRPELAADHERFWQQHLQGGPVLAVHVRGSDKITEQADLVEINASYHGHIGSYLQREPGIRLFLLTDSSAVLEDFRQRYGQRLIHTDCARSGDAVGVHHQPHVSRRQVGLEVLQDVYLAGRCDYFLGNGHSNVSTTVLHLKEWPPERCRLLVRNRLTLDNFFLHARD